jgi:hypothetical protein
MKIDVYTKIVLTGIFGCLLWLCIVLTPIGTPVQAQLGPTQVVVAGFQDGGQVIPFSAKRGLPVTVVSPTPSASAAPQPLMGGLAPAAPAAPAVERPSPPPPISTQPARLQCAATTKRGTRCSRLADVGSSFCWQHK